MRHAPPDASQAARAMMPGVFVEMPIDEELLLANRMARLQCVIFRNERDREFCTSIRGARPGTLSEKQRLHVERLAWRYRLQIPKGLRPSCDPDLNPNPEAH